ncbi:hypothetical protein Cni_G11624 [Canna indica]|uniref:Leucine-rich repeat-containing N-terminal plant-type domain-containing protein n=1 Tax=Canna indica TaxID=4628 RepID=A0AAQ3K6Q6_9LILI|nr:hypothetical protein Cni_G11624 [Canna indica]
MLEVFLLIMPSSCKRCFKAERAALLDFKAGVVDDPSYLLSSWKVVEDCCRWSGVVCDNQTGHVVELNLQPYMKVGFLNQSLLSLTHLDRLNLSYNDFGGIQIPDFMGSFPKLRYLDLSSSNFSSKIPSQLGNLSTLLYLDLSIWRTRAVARTARSCAFRRCLELCRDGKKRLIELEINMLKMDLNKITTTLA